MNVIFRICAKNWYNIVCLQNILSLIVFEKIITLSEWTEFCYSLVSFFILFFFFLLFFLLLEFFLSRYFAKSLRATALKFGRQISLIEEHKRITFLGPICYRSYDIGQKPKNMGHFHAVITLEVIMIQCPY